MQLFLLTLVHFLLAKQLFSHHYSGTNCTAAFQTHSRTSYISQNSFQVSTFRMSESSISFFSTSDLLTLRILLHFQPLQDSLGPETIVLSQRTSACLSAQQPSIWLSFFTYPALFPRTKTPSSLPCTGLRIQRQPPALVFSRFTNPRLLDVSAPSLCGSPCPSPHQNAVSAGSATSVQNTVCKHLECASSSGRLSTRF